MADTIALNEIELDIFTVLDAEISLSEEDYQPELLKAKVKAAYREVRGIRRYPISYTEGQIINDMYKYFENIRKIALYDYNQVGAEFQSAYSDSTGNRSYSERGTLFYGIIPLSTVGD